MGFISKLRRVGRDPKNVVSMLKYRFLSAIGHSGFKRFIVLSRSRTGSNMLLSLLNSHLGINVEGEIFGRLNGRDYSKVLATAFGKQPYYIKAKGFKIFYYHPIDNQGGSLWNEIISTNDLCVIHLKRRNILRTILSKKLAEKNNVWLVTNSELESSHSPNQVSFTAKELKDGFEETRRWEDNGDALFENNNIVTVYYEDLVDNVEHVFNELTDVLGVEYVKPKTNLKKQNVEKTSDLIENYEELKLAFSGTEWEVFFD